MLKCKVTYFVNGTDIAETILCCQLEYISFSSYYRFITNLEFVNYHSPDLTQQPYFLKHAVP